MRASHSALFLVLPVLGALSLPIHPAHSAAPVRIPEIAAQKGLEITSDKPEYCQKLDRALTHHLQHPHSVPVGIMEDARLLQKRGQELCTQGNIRGGIERLRRGLVLLKNYKKSFEAPQSLK